MKSTNRTNHHRLASRKGGVWKWIVERIVWSRWANKVKINAYYKTMKVFLTLHACQPVVGTFITHNRGTLNITNMLLIFRLTHSFLHGDFVVVTDGVFSREVELHHVLLSVHLRVQSDVLHTQRAAAHRICRLPLVLLITSPQSQLHTNTNTHQELSVQHRVKSPTPRAVLMNGRLKSRRNQSKNTCLISRVRQRVDYDYFRSIKIY